MFLLNNIPPNCVQSLCVEAFPVYHHFPKTQVWATKAIASDWQPNHLAPAPSELPSRWWAHRRAIPRYSFGLEPNETCGRSPGHQELAYNPNTRPGLRVGPQQSQFWQHNWIFDWTSHKRVLSHTLSGLSLRTHLPRGTLPGAETPDSIAPGIPRALKPLHHFKVGVQEGVVCPQSVTGVLLPQVEEFKYFRSCSQVRKDQSVRLTGGLEGSPLLCGYCTGPIWWWTENWAQKKSS